MTQGKYCYDCGEMKTDRRHDNAARERIEKKVKELGKESFIDKASYPALRIYQTYHEFVPCVTLKEVKERDERLAEDLRDTITLIGFNDALAKRKAKEVVGELRK